MNKKIKVLDGSRIDVTKLKPYTIGRIEFYVHKSKLDIKGGWLNEENSISFVHRIFSHFVFQSYFCFVRAI